MTIKLINKIINEIYNLHIFLCFGFNFQPDPTVEGQNNITQLN